MTMKAELQESRAVARKTLDAACFLGYPTPISPGMSRWSLGPDRRFVAAKTIG